jgi:HSP20 family protein
MPFKGSPFEDLEELFDRMSREFGADLPVASGIRVDVIDRGEEFEVVADMPGFENDDIDVTFANGTLLIHADATVEVDDEEGEYVRRERRERSVSRSVRIPDPVDEDGIAAGLSDGVLRVTLPKQSTGESGHRIEIE